MSRFHLLTPTKGTYGRLFQCTAKQRNAPIRSKLLHCAKMSTASASSATIEPPSLITYQKGSLMCIELNKPKTLNSLTLDMCVQMNELLFNKIEAKDSDIGAFMILSKHPKAFCAGGDIKSVWQEVQTMGDQHPDLGRGKAGYLHADFFREEYIMNHLLSTSNTPQISIWDGIVMGGGVGLSLFGEFRIATEKTMFAMPETAIGIFPDVGGSAWLPHLQNGYGAYIGMSGVRLGAADLMHTGMATHYMTSEQAAQLETILADSNIPTEPHESRKHVKQILKELQQQCGGPPPADAERAIILPNAAEINHCFGKDSSTVEDVVDKLSALAATDNTWAQKTLQTLQKMSPTSLKLTWRQLQKGAPLDIKGCLRMEYRMMQHCMQRSADFREGIRAVLVDKDQNPQWSPADLSGVNDDFIDGFFEPLGEEYDLDVFAKHPTDTDTATAADAATATSTSSANNK